MSTLPKQKFSLSARHSGPVLTLDGGLTMRNQNLAFARNGTGKSFLSRAFRYLDLHWQQEDVSDAAFSFVSDESTDGSGSFVFSRGSKAMWALNLQKEGNAITAKVIDGEAILSILGNAKADQHAMLTPQERWSRLPCQWRTNLKKTSWFWHTANERNYKAK